MTWGGVTESRPHRIIATCNEGLSNWRCKPGMPGSRHPKCCQQVRPQKLHIFHPQSTKSGPTAENTAVDADAAEAHATSLIITFLHRAGHHGAFKTTVALKAKGCYTLYLPLTSQRLAVADNHVNVLYTACYKWCRHDILHYQPGMQGNSMHQYAIQRQLLAVVDHLPNIRVTSRQTIMRSTPQEQELSRSKRPARQTRF